MSRMHYYIITGCTPARGTVSSEYPSIRAVLARRQGLGPSSDVKAIASLDPLEIGERIHLAGYLSVTGSPEWPTLGGIACRAEGDEQKIVEELGYR